MLELFRTPAAFAIEPKSVSRVRNCVLFVARLIFWPLALLTLVALALELGAYRKEFKIAGPFAAESDPAGHSLILAVPQEGRAARWRQPLLGDSNEKPLESILELQIDGRKIGPPHSQHEAIRKETTAGFSHWGPNLIFSLPPGVKNVPETMATLNYSVRPRAWVTFALAAASALLGWLLYDRALTLLARRLRALALFAQRYAERPIAVVLRVPYLILFGLCCAALIGSVVYVASSLYALATGWALPTTALIRWSPIAAWAARNEPYLGHLLLMVAGFGALVTWLAGSNLQHRRLIDSDEQRLRKLLVWCGFPIVACAFVFCISAMWAGMVRPGDLHSANMGGLIPFSDAQGYLASAFDQAKDGTWITFALRRPLAAAFRSVLLFFGNYSLQFMLVAQACLTAAAACFAAYAVTMWRGIWAGIAFFGLTYIYGRIFVPTTLTEPLGLFWALLSIPFFIETFRSGSVKPALMALAMTAVALMTRMGSMFTIPALLVWLVWQFGHGAAAKLRIGVVSIGILLGILGLNSLLQKAYGTNQGSTGSNFSYVACGLSLGTNWQGCPAKLAAEGKTLQGEETTTQLYSLALENFRARPKIFFGRLADGAKEFATKFPDVMWGGYGAYIQKPDWLFRNLLTALSLIGVSYFALQRSAPIELTFWMLLWTSIVASSSVVYFDDGSRVLAASQPLIALFFVMGMSSPALASRESPRRSGLSRYGALGLIVTAALLVGVPWIAHRFFSPRGAVANDNLSPKQGEVYVFGGRRMSGFLVVADGQPLRSDVPTLHLADLKAMIEQTGVETYQGLIYPVKPPLPFGFVYAPRIEDSTFSWNQYIVPAEVVERRDITAWRFQVEPWNHGPNYWFYATKAEPWH